MQSYRFKPVQYRVFNKDTKQLHYVGQSSVLLLNGAGFQLMQVDDKGVADGVLADDSNSVLMQGVNFRDKNHTDIYEGDLLFFTVPMKRFLMPMVGIVSVKDFTYCINSVMGRIDLSYLHTNVEVLGNVFVNSEEELAKLTEARIAQYRPKEEKK